MPPNSGEYKSVVGVDNLYIAQVTQDDTSAYVAGTPQYLAPTASISMKPKTSMEAQYADNIPFDIAAAEAETDMEINITNLPASMYALLLGSHFDAATGTVDDVTGTPPFFAVGFRAMKSNGKYRYYWYQKCQFSAPEEGAETKTDKATPKEAKLNCKAIKTTYKFNNGATTDGIKRKFGDEDTTNFVGTTWFSQVQVPQVAAPAGLALNSSSPTTGATGVAVTATLTLTFNNALQGGEELDAVLINSATGAVIAGTNTIDATKKIITVGHTANLAAATLHRIIYTVKDVYGQILVGVVSFTTA
jgi:phi13 family phage major tail protein